ncbi:MAG: hypothetical protein MUC78_13825 [Bacteroidales bacterium]|jgi:hypothetical protein|nr:hypothetical protein [Bacteroidales bacterium]
MILSEIKDKIFGSLIGYFAEKDFKYVKTKDCFEQRTEDFRFVYKFLFHTRKSEIAIELFVLIEHNETERIYKNATNHIVFETIGNEIGKLVRNPDGKMKNHHSIDLIISEISDVSNITSLVKKYFEEIALPYYKKNGNLNRIDEILNSKPEEISVHSNAQFFRCPKGLIVAKLNNRGNFKELQEKYDKKMEFMNELAKQRYLKVKTYLEQLP